jgi:hypothetical protein
MVVLDITCEEGMSGRRRTSSFARVSASVGSTYTVDRVAAAEVAREAPVGYFTTFMLAVEPAAVGEQTIAQGCVSSWEEVFGVAEDVNYVFPMPYNSENGPHSMACGLASDELHHGRHLAVAAGSVGAVDISSETIMAKGVRTIVCIVYCLEGPSTVTLHAYAGTEVLPRSAVDRVAARVGFISARAVRGMLLCARLLGKVEHVHRALGGDEGQKQECTEAIAGAAFESASDAALRGKCCVEGGLRCSREHILPSGGVVAHKQDL